MPASDQKVTKDRYTLIPRTLIFLTCGSDILLLKGAPRKRLWAGLYNGIGGHVDRGEDVLSAARREFHEETGMYPPELRLTGVITIDAGQEIGVGIYVFTGQCPQGALIPSSEGELEWVPISEIGRYPLVEDLDVLIPRLLSMQAGDPPLSGHYAYDEEGKMIITFAR